MFTTYASAVLANSASTSVIISNSLLLLNETRTTPDETSWGASELNDSHRPDRSWINNFANGTVIQLTTDLDDAQGRCPQNGYCTIEINQLSLNETAYIWRPKTRLLGKSGNKITFPSNSNNDFSFFELSYEAAGNIEEVIFEGLNIDGQSISRNIHVNGIQIYGYNIAKIAIIGNSIHNIHSTNGAHGIAVYGTGATEASAVNNVIIEGNQVQNMMTGSSESIVTNGNVRNWEIKLNTVSNINNIGIDAIGGEGTSPTKTVNGRILPGKFDAARYGFIENNTVNNLSINHDWVAAIYVDGGRYIHIENNTVSNSEWGYEIGAENCVSANNITMVNNTSTNNYHGDLLIGGWNSKGFRNYPSINCNPLNTNDANEGHGYVENVSINNNTLSSTSPETATIKLQNRIHKTVINQPSAQWEDAGSYLPTDVNTIRF